MTEKAGYSGTPLARKLGIKSGFSMVLFHPPEHYFQLFADFPEDVEVLKEAGKDEYDFIHLFCRTMEELLTVPAKYKSTMKKDGMMWVSWPKGGSSIPTDLNREKVRDAVLAIGLVDIKVAAIDQNWSGLKFVYRRKDR